MVKYKNNQLYIRTTSTIIAGEVKTNKPLTSLATAKDLCKRSRIQPPKTYIDRLMEYTGCTVG